MTGKRAAREAELGRYEIPAFAAGMAIGHLETAQRLLIGQFARHGHTAYLDRAWEEVNAAILEARRWQDMAAAMTNYPYARKESR